VTSTSITRVGSAAAGGGAIIAVPWSEFQRPRELPLSRVRSGRRPGDYRGSVERISASARSVAIAGPQRPAAGRLSRVRGANFSVRESCRYRGSAAAGGRAIIARPWSEFQRPRELPLSSEFSASARAAAIAGPQRPAVGRLSRVRGANSQRPRELPLSRVPAAGGAAIIAAPWSEFQRPRELPAIAGPQRTGGGAIIAAPWSEFQRPRELPLSRVPQRPAAGRLSRVRGANFSVRESCRLSRVQADLA
jgi:hypothetical protein